MTPYSISPHPRGSRSSRNKLLQIPEPAVDVRKQSIRTYIIENVVTFFQHSYQEKIMPPTTPMRQEKDSIGIKEIPANVYYGVQAARAVENYPISGMRAHPVLIRAIGMVKQAAA